MAFLGGLFGGGTPQIKQSGYRSNQAAALTQSGALAPAYTSMGDQGRYDYQTYHPEYQQAAQTYTDTLKRNPFTDSETTRQRAELGQGMASHYLNANAHIAASANNRGIDGGIVAGATANNENAFAGGMSQIDNQVYDHEQSQLQANQAQLAQFYGSATNDALQQERQGYAGAQNVYNGQFSGYNSLAGDQEAIDRQNAQMKLQEQEQLSQFVGGLGNTAATLYTGGAFGGGRKKVQGVV